MGLPAISGNFLGNNSSATAILVRTPREMEYGVAILASDDRERSSRIVIKLQAKDIGTNPPALGVVPPGTINPVCHGGGICKPITIKTDAISLCFGEASCEIIYLDGKSFRAAFVTD